MSKKSAKGGDVLEEFSYFPTCGDDEETIDRRGDVCKKGELEV